MNRRMLGILAGSFLSAAMAIDLVDLYYTVTGLSIVSGNMLVISGVLLSIEGWAFKEKASVVGGALLAASGILYDIMWFILISSPTYWHSPQTMSLFITLYYTRPGIACLSGFFFMYKSRNSNMRIAGLLISIAWGVSILESFIFLVLAPLISFESIEILEYAMLTAGSGTAFGAGVQIIIAAKREGGTSTLAHEQQTTTRHVNKKMAMVWSILGICMIVIGIVVIAWGPIRLEMLKNEYHDYLRRCFSSCSAADWNYFTNVLRPQLSNPELWMPAYLLSGGIVLVAGIDVTAAFFPKMRTSPTMAHL